MKFVQVLKYYWIIILTTLVISFWLGFSITELVNHENTCYSVSFNSEEIHLTDINKDFFLKALEKFDDEGNLMKDEEGNIIYSYASVKPNDFFDNNDIVITSDSSKIEINIKAHYFIGIEENIISEKSLDRFNKVMKKVLKFHDKNVVIEDSVINSYTNPILPAVFGLVGGFILCGFVLFILRNKLIIESSVGYEKRHIYRWPIYKEYWQKAIDSVRNIKVFDMCMISILFALQIVMKFVSIPTGFPGLNIVLNYLIFALITLIYGPIWGVIIGFGSDIIGFVMNPVLFHFGYTIQAMLTGLVYGLCFYKTELKFSKALVSRIIINILLNGVMGSFLWGDYNGWNIEASILYMWAVSLPKNIIYLIPQTILLYVFLRAVVVLPIRKGMIPKETLPNKYESL